MGGIARCWLRENGNNIQAPISQEEPIEQQPQEEIEETPHKIEEVPLIEDESVHEKINDIVVTVKPKDIDADIEFIQAEIGVEPQLKEIQITTKPTDEVVEFAQEIIEARSETAQELEKSKKKHKKSKTKKKITKDNIEVPLQEEEPIFRIYLFYTIVSYHS
ncbi:hypothetical protein QE152_g5767 [Popillia japonica]|uniref:Uncharacterized protein n=1 Tax=Popillia japonica TaxID=7064 RepID=A0AAW1MHC2_POPJA